jgi:hypothetical protein
MVNYTKPLRVNGPPAGGDVRDITHQNLIRHAYAKNLSLSFSQNSPPAIG